MNLGHLTTNEIISHLEIYGTPEDQPILKAFKEMRLEVKSYRDDMQEMECQGQSNYERIEELEQENSELIDKLEVIKKCLEDI